PDRGGEHAMPSLAQMWEWPCPGEVHFVATDDTLCVFGGDWRTAETRILLWGDSHAEHYAPILQAAIAEHHSVSVALLRGCPPIYGRSVFRIDTDPGRTPEKCRQSRDRGL